MRRLRPVRLSKQNAAPTARHTLLRREPAAASAAPQAPAAASALGFRSTAAAATISWPLGRDIEEALIAVGGLDVWVAQDSSMTLNLLKELGGPDYQLVRSLYLIRPLRVAQDRAETPEAMNHNRRPVQQKETERQEGRCDRDPDREVQFAISRRMQTLSRGVPRRIAGLSRARWDYSRSHRP
jgi:hypothetical protein